jgi:hypothetical protein
MLKRNKSKARPLIVTTHSYRFYNTPLRRYGLAIGLGVVSILIILMIAPVILNMLKAGNDYPAHLFSAEFWAKYGYPDRPRPQFLFHVLVIFLSRILPGISIPYAGLILSLMYYVALSVIIFVLVYALFTGFSSLLKLVCSVILTLILMLVGPINVITFPPSNLYFGYVPPNAYHSPTVALLRPFALLLFIYACRVYTNFRKSYVNIMVCALVSALGAMAKPSYAIVIIPVLGLLTLIKWWQSKPINWMLLIAGIALPTAIVLIWQQNYYRETNMGGFIIAPLLVMSFYSPNNLLLKLVLSIAFPLCVFVFYYREALKDTSMQIGWLGLLVGIFYTYFLAESVGWTDGNFTWSGQIAVFILFVASVIFFVRQNMPLLTQRRFTPALLICTLLLLLHLVGGLALYYASLRPDWLSWL